MNGWFNIDVRGSKEWARGLPFITVLFEFHATMQVSFVSSIVSFIKGFQMEVSLFYQKWDVSTYDGSATSSLWIA